MNGFKSKKFEANYKYAREVKSFHMYEKMDQQTYEFIEWIYLSAWTKNMNIFICSYHGFTQLKLTIYKRNI